MMQSQAEPVSWLLLERYALGELDDHERREVEARLAQRPEDAAILRTLSPAHVLPAQAPVRRLRFTRNNLFASALAAAAAVLLLVRPRAPDVYVDKGGEEVALALVSDLQGAGPRSFVHGERFKVQVTCPPSLQRELGVLVFQGGERFEPLLRGAVRCGENLAVWPGALSLDGEREVDVCVVWGRALDRARAVADVAEEGVCERLTPRAAP